MEWIDVNDRLPDTNKGFHESEFVLCYDIEHYETFVAWYNSKTNCWTLAHYRTDSQPVRVDFWQPLPQPPQTTK